ncbi:MAG: tripartite tricarboxylate transporter TctB family protein [Symploca sp. SIO2C1]|nr:tripartite tricarboxylate transporter TctB family protein [Symploca sp. SIO2C1]
MSDRIFAGLMLVFALYYGFEAYALNVPFAYDPLGPRAFPIFLAALLAILTLFILFSSELQQIDWPKDRLLVKSVLVVATLVGYGLTLFGSGFIISTALMIALLGRLFEATWLQSGVAGITLGLLFYALFGWLLQIPLPSGGF